MRRTLLMIMAVALLLTQCRKPAVELPTAEPANTVSMTITAGPGGKTDISETGGITWSTDDKLYVGYNNTYVGCLTLQSGAGSATGMFTGDVTLPDGTTGEQTFHFFYLGSNPPAVLNVAASATVSFASQTGLRDGLGSCHVGHGSAKGAVSDGGVTGISVMMKSEVALARFSFKKSGTPASPYEGALTLSGANIYNSMTVGFGGTFSGTKTGGGEISLTDATLSEKYVMFVPAGATAATLNFGGEYEGVTELAQGIEANKYYGQGGPIEVAVTESPYVDLGLSVRWAKCNLGATSPGDYGNYYAWGETAGYNEAMDGNGANSGENYSPGTVKTDYVWAYYKWGRDKNNLGKYVNQTGYGMSTPDDKTVLDAEDDAAHAVWGGDWRMPTADEFTELIENTNHTWKAANAPIKIGGQTVSMTTAGYYCVSKKTGYTDKYIFLPAAGKRDGTDLNDAGSIGYYWSSSLYTEPYRSRRLYLNSDRFYMTYSARYLGFTVRPVCPRQN